MNKQNQKKERIGINHSNLQTVKLFQVIIKR